MANIATVATAGILKRGVPPGFVTSRAMLRVMTQYYGKSYFVPTWGYNDYTLGCIYTQHGEKWSPTGVAKAWKRFSRFLEAIWVRWYDDGSEHDQIFTYTTDGYGSSDCCYYGFDRVRVSGSAALGKSLRQSEWRLEAQGVWSADFKGRYKAANDRSDLLSDYPTRPSRTTPVVARMLGRGPLNWALDDFLMDITQIESAILAEATTVEFYWRERATRVYQRCGDRWWSWCLDDWDNCLASGWLAAHTRQGEKRWWRGRFT